MPKMTKKQLEAKVAALEKEIVDLKTELLIARAKAAPCAFLPHFPAHMPPINIEPRVPMPLPFPGSAPGPVTPFATIGD